MTISNNAAIKKQSQGPHMPNLNFISFFNFMLTLTGNRNDAIIDLGTLLREK
jgi:hypothetical protein